MTIRRKELWLNNNLEGKLNKCKNKVHKLIKTNNQATNIVKTN